MNKIQLHIEYAKNIQKYCLNCKRCFAQFNDPNVTIPKKVKVMMQDYIVDSLLDERESPETLENIFLECFNPKEKVT